MQPARVPVRGDNWVVSTVIDWLRTHDAGYAALRRAARTAIVMPVMFAIGDKVIGNPVLATFAAFGSFAMLLLVDFSGPIRDRVRNQAALGVTCAFLIAIATLVSRTTWLAAVAMALVAFAVLFAGVVSSALAGATTALLLSFILPVTLPGGLSSIPDRLMGWGLAAAVSLPAIALLWPAPARNPVRKAAVDACRALAGRLRADVAFLLGDQGSDAEAAHAAAVAEADAAVDTMERRFFATPYQPGGLTTDGRALIKMIDELRWLDGIILRSAPMPRPRNPEPSVLAVKQAAADVLDSAADRVEQPERDDNELRGSVERMRAALAELEQSTMTLPRAEGVAAVVSALNPRFRAQELSFVVERIANNADFAAAAAQRSWVDRLMGRLPPGFAPRRDAARRRASAHLTWQSVALQNSLRGAAALGLSVIVADVTSVQHGFWVILGTFAVLRSNALSTGQSVAKALVGTSAGFVVGGLLVYLIGTDTTVLWVLLPIAILFAGLAPAAISFAAGQAAFTLTLLILFNLIAPAGWQVGLVRIEDVALGCLVSLAVGVLFWPRGATAGLSRALADGYHAAANYLAAAVAYGVECCDGGPNELSAPRPQGLAAAAASRRLDDAFRGYLSERGAKPAALAEVSELVTGVTGVGLAADAVLDLWSSDGAPGGERGAARRELLAAATSVTGWYDRFAASLVGEARVPDPLARDDGANGRLAEAVARDLRAPDGEATATGVRVIWTGDHLDAVRRLQEALVEPALAAVSGVASPAEAASTGGT
jgi:uncharacterized membrane protein YccC